MRHAPFSWTKIVSESTACGSIERGHTTRFRTLSPRSDLTKGHRLTVRIRGDGSPSCRSSSRNAKLSRRRADEGLKVLAACKPRGVRYAFPFTNPDLPGIMHVYFDVALSKALMPPKAWSRDGDHNYRLPARIQKGSQCACRQRARCEPFGSQTQGGP